MCFRRWCSVVAVLTVTVLPALGQVRPAATRGGLPLVVGAGFSNYNVDFGGGRREDGGTLWLDWTLRQVPPILQGVGIEVEARDLSFGAPAGLSDMRYDTAGGGVIYHVLRWRYVHPYAKLEEQFGSLDFPVSSGYNHDTRSLLAFGGGADVHAWGALWVRADYEYQRWPDLFGHNTALTPNGFTIGPEWDFGPR